jgi:sugar (pentulose or hexulose) kinase
MVALLPLLAAGARGGPEDPVVAALVDCVASALELGAVEREVDACLAAWVDTKPVVKPDGNLNPDNTILAAWLNPEALVNMGDSQMLDGTSFSWTPAKGSLLASDSHKNGPMVKRNQANGFPVVSVSYMLMSVVVMLSVFST